MSVLKGVKDTIEVPITAEVEGDNGRVITVKFKATYRKLRVEEGQEVLRRFELPPDDDDALTDEEAMEKYLIGWRELRGEDGQEIEFAPDVLADAMQVREYRVALVRGFLEALLGREAVQRKNSSRRATLSA